MKTLVSGPLFASDDGLTPADEIFPSTDPNTADDGVIGVTLLHSQHYVVEIVLENTGGNGDSDGIVLTDVFGADIDLDPIAQDDYEDGGLPLDGLCEGALAINCDIDGGGNNGVILTGDCSYVLSQPDSASNSNPTAKQPEFIDIRIDDLDEDETCTVLVFVQTVENPGTGNEFFEPTSCRELAFTTGNGSTGDPIYDTFTLNEGLKSFSGVNGHRLAGPEESLQLTCIFPSI